MQNHSYLSGRLKILIFVTGIITLFSPAIMAQTLQPEQKPEDFQPKLPELATEPAAWQPEPPQPDPIQEVDETTLIAQPKLLNLLLDKSVLRDDPDGIRILLPVYRKLPASSRDPILQALAESKLSMHQGNFREAVAKLRPLIAARPDLYVIRMYLATALFYDRQNLAAEDQFNKLLAHPDLPLQAQKTARRFLAELQQHHRWQFGGGADYTYEPNINNAPTVKRQGSLDTESHPESAHGISYRLSAEKNTALPHGFVAKFNAGIQGKHYPARKQYNDLMIDTSAGIGYGNARFDSAIMPFATKRWWQGSAAKSGLQSYSESFGLNLSLNTRLNRRIRLNQSARIEKINHKHRFRFDGIHRQTGHTLIYQSSPKQAWFGGADYRRETLHDPDNSNHQWTASLGWIQEWPKGISTRTRAALITQKYHAPMPWPIQKTRKDRAFQLQLSIWHRNFHFLGITPRVTFQHTRNRSNIFLYDYLKNNMFLEFSKTF